MSQVKKEKYVQTFRLSKSRIYHSPPLDFEHSILVWQANSNVHVSVDPSFAVMTYKTCNQITVTVSLEANFL